MRREEGQAAAELVALLPALAATLAVMWQLALAGFAVWQAGSAARAAARAAAVGEDARPVARVFDRGARVRLLGAGRVRVSVPVRSVLPGLRFGSVSSEAAFAVQEGG